MIKFSLQRLDREKTLFFHLWIGSRVGGEREGNALWIRLELKVGEVGPERRGTLS